MQRGRDRVHVLRTDPRSGQFYVYLETIGGGLGAGEHHDGLDGVQVHMTNTSNLPIECLESEYPLTVERYELIDDSGGPGRTAADGIRRTLRVEHDDCRCEVSTSRLLSRPWGLFASLYLSTERGLQVAGTTTYLLVQILGGFIGYVSSGFFHDRFGRRPTQTVAYLFAITSMLLFVLAPVSSTALGYLLIFVVGLCVSGCAGRLGAILSEQFPHRRPRLGARLHLQRGPRHRRAGPDDHRVHGGGRRPRLVDPRRRLRSRGAGHRHALAAPRDQGEGHPQPQLTAGAPSGTGTLSTRICIARSE